MERTKTENGVGKTGSGAASLFRRKEPDGGLGFPFVPTIFSTKLISQSKKHLIWRVSDKENRRKLIFCPGTPKKFHFTNY